MFRTRDLAAETRWPAFTPTAAAARIGMRSMLSFRLAITGTTFGFPSGLASVRTGDARPGTPHVFESPGGKGMKAGPGSDAA